MDTSIAAAPRHQPRQVPPNRRVKFRLPRSDRFLRLLHRTLSAWQKLLAWLQVNTFAPLWLPKPWRQPLVGALVSVLLAGGATGLTLLLADTLPVFALPGMLFMLGIVVAALTWGVGPSLLATFVGTALLEGVVLPHYFPVFREAWLATIHAGLFVLLGLSVSLLVSRGGRAHWHTEEVSHALNANQAWTERERLRLRTLLDVLPVAVGMLDAQARVVETNLANQALWGEGASRPGEVAAAQIWEGWWPETGQPVAPDEWAIMRALLSGETILNQEIAIEPLPGQRKVILESAAPIRDEHGTILGAADIHQDITERKQLEAALRQAEREAAARAVELEAIFEALTDGLLVYDADGRILRSNTVARQLFGFEAHPEFGSLPWQERAIRYAPRDAEGQPLPPEDLTLSRLLRGEVLTSAQAVDNRLQTPDGREVTFSMTGRPLRDAEGEIVGAVAIARDVTERRRLEREVAERAAQLAAIFESVADGLVVTDAHGRIIQMNQALRTLLGIDLDPTGRTRLQLEGLAGYAAYTTAGHPLREGEDPISTALQGQILTSEQSVNLLFRTRDGREVWTNGTSAPIRDATGQIIGCVGVIRDVTERRRLERAVAEHAAQLAAIFESMADGVVVTDCQRRVLHMNQAVKTLLGIEQDPKGLTIPELEVLAGFSARTAQGQPLTEAERPITRYLQGEVLTRQQSVNLILQTRDGRELLLNNTGAPIRNAAGNIMGGVEVIRDVTEQRRLEQHTHQTLGALLAMAEALVQAPDQASAAGADGSPDTNQVARRLAELTRSVLECQYVGIAAVEPETLKLTPITIVGLSSEHEQRWWASWDEQSRLGQHLHPSAVKALRAGEPVQLDSGQAPLAIWDRIAQAHQSLMVPMRVGETLVGILRTDGGAKGEAFMCSDRQALVRAVARLGALVLERERLLRERAEAQANEMALREANAQMDTFLGMVGHELKTPLTSLKLALQLAERRSQQALQRTPDAANAVVPLLELAARPLLQADRLDRLVNDLLDVSRVQAGKLELHPAAVDLAAIVREAVEEQRQANPARVLILQFPDDFSLPVTADADRIGQVVTNYLTNALKYSPADHPVNVGLAVEGQQARVWVRDEGPGLPTEEQERIWDRFHRVKGIQVQSGTGVGLGLGLHICRTIIERQQGQVGVESVPGQGATFWFTLPLIRQG